MYKYLQITDHIDVGGSLYFPLQGALDQVLAIVLAI